MKAWPGVMDDREEKFRVTPYKNLPFENRSRFFKIFCKLTYAS